MNKAPQERQTEKKITTSERGGHPTLVLDGNDTSLSVQEIVGRKRRGPTFRSPEEVRQLRDFAQSWLDYHEEQETDE